MATIPERLQRLRAEMLAHGLCAYILPSADDHSSTYLHPHFQVRAYFSGFTGSSGTLVVFAEHAALFTDARYFLQAEAQLADAGITLMRMQEPGVPDLPEYLLSCLTENETVGANARTFPAALWQRLCAKLAEKNCQLLAFDELIDRIWPDRPVLPDAPVICLPPERAGETTDSKLARLRAEMRAQQAQAHILCSLDDIAWLYNLRGSDIPCNPLAFAFTIVEETEATLFIDAHKLPSSCIQELAAFGVRTAPYADVYAYAPRCSGQRVLIDPERVNYALYAQFAAVATIRHAQNPTILMKAVKNKAELAAMRQAHLADGIAFAKFLYALYTRTESLTEASAGELLARLRMQQGAVSESFPAIVAHKAHAAIVHYTATPETDAPLTPEGFLLIDSGGQYGSGTTDVTRTIALGPLSTEQRRQYTLVLSGMIHLAAAVFPETLRCDQLDVCARMPLWSVLADYKHGTGHGIGSYLCVHEPPIRVYYHASNPVPLSPGMVLSDEPGVYIAGSHGIRIENQLCVEQAGESEYGRFLRFETLTLIPIDTSPIDCTLMSAQDIAWLNAYHAHVYDRIAPHLCAEERAFLEKITRAI